jgi:hypothetical protein
MGNLVERFFKLEPALVRGILVAIAGLVAQILGRTVIDNDTIDLLIDLFTGLSAVLATIWTRGAVTANAKVVVANENPLGQTPVLVSGDSNVTVGTTGAHVDDLVAAAVGNPVVEDL